MCSSGTSAVYVLLIKEFDSVIPYCVVLNGIEFMVPFLLDFRYWEDGSDEFRPLEGSLLPLWKFHHDRSRHLVVTDICWSPIYTDLFAAAYAPSSGEYTAVNGAVGEKWQVVRMSEVGKEQKCVDVGDKYSSMDECDHGVIDDGKWIHITVCV